ncbi:unnamed protein product [Rotaria sordida]|uniref:Protein kinase domain-containing protein n=1 Tax=Rotaria sordida TaxID=392033 RepID=A0A814VPL5_9BILA|nr:unnamed protein product [Rotaria sordida]CAF1457958.1 unnamed protein product [Rotaria sordida]CAF3616234.1 unnamed protein product [Rotaria sordida]
MRQGVINKQHQNDHPLVATSNQSLTKIDISDIRKGNVLGQGAFGQVCKAKWLSKNRQVACKVIRVTPQRRHLEESFRKELAAYVELSGAFILKTFGYGDRMLDNGVKECYLITELMHRGSLANVIHNRDEKISLRRKFSMACHIASGMRKLHAHTMIHRDIRPDNILVSSNFTAKIGDMGIAHIFNPDERHTLIGCLPFMPPEFHRGDGQYDQSLDVFTYGLTLNELFTEKIHRFNQSTKHVQLIEQSPIFIDLILKCILDESTRRPTAIKLEHTLHKYRQAVDRHIKEKCPNYTNQTIATKDSIFIHFYNEYHQQEKAKPKAVFSPPPRPHINLDLIRQHFEDMMKQFSSIDEKDADRNKDQSEVMKFKKYLDNPSSVPVIGPIKKDRRPSTPSPNCHPAEQENHQHFLRVIKHRRSRTPSPIPPHLKDPLHDQDFFHMPDRCRALGNNHDDIEQRMRRLGFKAVVDHPSPHFDQIMRKLK